MFKTILFSSREISHWNLVILADYRLFLKSTRFSEVGRKSTRTRVLLISDRVHFLRVIPCNFLGNVILGIHPHGPSAGFTSRIRAHATLEGLSGGTLDVVWMPTDKLEKLETHFVSELESINNI